MTRLPDAYQEVEYLRGTGTQYIRTSYFATGNTSVKLKFRVNELEGKGIFGSINQQIPITNAYYLIGASSGVWRFQYGNQNFNSTITTDTNWHVWEQRKNTCFLDNKLLYTFTKQEFQNSYEQLIFGIGGSGTTLSALNIGKNDIGIVEYWENNELTMQLIPCYRKSDNVAGYYDTVFNEFLTNAGTGTFEVGADVNKPELRMMYWKGDRLPAEYQELSYIESTGTQWIDTGIKTGTNIKIDFEYEATAFNGSTFCAPMSARVSNLSNSISYGFNYLDTYASFGNNAEMQIIPTVSLGEKYHIVQDKTALYTNDVKTPYKSGQTTTFTTLLNLYLFARNNKGSVGNYFWGKIYYAKIWDNNNLVRNFIPCFRKSDNAVGMYDTVGGKFYTNSGTGTFKKGAIKHDLRFFYTESNKLPNDVPKKLRIIYM